MRAETKALWLPWHPQTVTTTHANKQSLNPAAQGQLAEPAVATDERLQM